MADPVSLALGIVPLCLSAIQGIEAARSRLKILRNYDHELRRLRKKFTTQTHIFLDECHLLLQEVIDPDDVVFMIEDVNSELWSSVGIDEKLNAYLGRRYEDVRDTVEEIGDHIKSLDEDLNGVLGKDAGGTKSSGRIREALTVMRNKSDYETRVGKIKELNQEFKRLRKMAKQVYEARSKTSRTRQKPLPSAYSAIAACSRSFHNALQHYWSCFQADHIEHHMALLLERKRDDMLCAVLRFHSKTGFQMKIDYVDFTVTSHIMKCHQSSFPVPLSSVEVNAIQDEVRPRKKMKVNFQNNYRPTVFALSDSQPSPSKASRLGPEIIGLDGADDICRVICQQANPKRSSTVGCLASYINSFDNYQHLLYPSVRHGESPCRKPTTELVPFVRALNQAIEYALSVPQQLRLALTIARGMLQLHSTPWWHHYWTLQDLSYFHDDNLAESLSTLHVSTELVTRQDSVANGIPDEIAPSSKEAEPLRDSVKEAQLTYGIRNLTVYSLGVALLQIGYWCALNPDDVVVVRKMASVNSRLGPRYQRLTQKCIDCDFGCGSDLGKPELQSAIYTDVVEELESLVGALEMK